MALRPVLLQSDQVHIQSVWAAHNMSLFFQKSHRGLLVLLRFSYFHLGSHRANARRLLLRIVSLGVKYRGSRAVLQSSSKFKGNLE